MAGESRYLPLLTVILDLAMVRRGLVLMKGKDYWRIEDSASQARRDAASGPPVVQAFLTEPRFYWTSGSDGKVIVMEETPDGEKVYAVEPGSEVPVPAS